MRRGISGPEWDEINAGETWHAELPGVGCTIEAYAWAHGAWQLFDGDDKVGAGTEIGVDAAKGAAVEAAIKAGSLLGSRRWDYDAWGDGTPRYVRRYGNGLVGVAERHREWVWTLYRNGDPVTAGSDDVLAYACRGCDVAAGANEAGR